MAAKVDVADEDQVIAAMAALVDRFGAVHSCFANAAVTGAYRNPPFIDSTLDDWRDLMRVNLDGAYVTLHESSPADGRARLGRQPGGHLDDRHPVRGTREQAYAASKGGIEALMKGLAVELAKHGIRANAIQPGWTMSPQTGAWAAAPGVADKILPRIPARRWGRADEWAGVAVYLASDASTWHTGDTLRLDGGYGVF